MEPQQEKAHTSSFQPGNSTAGPVETFRSPGLSIFRLVVTVLGIIALTALFIFIAIYEGLVNQFSTIAGLIFLAGFVVYLWIIAPVPFEVTLSPEGISRVPRKGAAVQANWADLGQIKEEVNNRGVTISVSVYKGVKVKKKLFAVYRDDIPNLDELRAALHAAIPPTCAWEREEVHE